MAFRNEKWWAGVRPSKVWDFTAGLPNDIAFTRASSGTYVGADGLIATAATNEARIQYSSAGVVQGLLVEEARTNLALYSNDLTNAAWTASTMTTAMTATGADGVANSATTLTATAGNATVLQAITSGSAARIQSCYIKRRTGTGTVNLTQDNGSTWTAVTVTAGWTRVNVPAATLANPTIGIRIVTSGDAVDVQYMQQEVGSSVTSPNTTTSASVTRAADVASVAVGPLYNQLAGTWVIEYTPLSTTAQTTTGGMSTLPVAAGSFMSIGPGTKTGWYATGLASGIPTLNTLTKQAVSYNSSGLMRSIRDGAAAVESSSSDYTGGVTSVVFGVSNVTYLNGAIKRARYYPRVLPTALGTVLSGP